jgi:dTDP-4-amino-4,6-dideoxygalactose transaminase
MEKKRNRPIMSSPLCLTENCPLDREEVRNRLSEAGIQTSVHYPSVHEFSIYSRNYTKLPLTEYAARREITLPLYYSMTLEQVDYVSNALEEILR